MKNVIHTLGTLFTYIKKFNPDLVNNFSELEEYCTKNDTEEKREDPLSLSLVVDELRLKMSRRDLEKFFYMLLCEAAALKQEGNLYTNIYKFKTLKDYFGLTNPEITTKSFEQEVKLFGKNLKELRKKEGLTLEKLGLMVGKTKSNIAEIEKGNQNLTLKTMCNIAEAFNVPVGCLFNY